MRLRRSAGEVSEEAGAVVPVEVLAAMAADWYGDRMDPDWQPRTLEASQEILERHGLAGPFWRLGQAADPPRAPSRTGQKSGPD
jgi:hypothetical protein